MDWSAMDETLLIQLAREGRPEAIEELFGRVWPLVWHWAFGVTGARTQADHVAQEAIYRAFAALDRFESGRPFRPWLKRITVNRAIDALRREVPHVPLTVEPIDTRSDIVEFEGLRSDVIDAVRLLPERQRLVIVLHYWLDCSVEEIASILNIPVGTVASRMNRARSRLKEQIGARF